MEEVVEVGASRGKDKPRNPLMISVEKVRIRPGRGKGKSDGWFPQPLTQRTPKPSSPCTPFAPQGSGIVSGMGSPLPTLFQGWG